MNSNQIGRFAISEDLIRADPDMVRDVLVMLGVIVVRAEAKFETGEIECVGICNKFEELKPGEMAPYYIIGIITDGKGVVLGVKAEKRNYRKAGDGNWGGMVETINKSFEGVQE